MSRTRDARKVYQRKNYLPLCVRAFDAVRAITFEEYTPICFRPRAQIHPHRVYDTHLRSVRPWRTRALCRRMEKKKGRFRCWPVTHTHILPPTTRPFLWALLCVPHTFTRSGVARATNTLNVIKAIMRYTRRGNMSHNTLSLRILEAAATRLTAGGGGGRNKSYTSCRGAPARTLEEPTAESVRFITQTREAGRPVSPFVAPHVRFGW